MPGCDTQLVFLNDTHGPHLCMVPIDGNHQKGTPESENGKRGESVPLVCVCVPPSVTSVLGTNSCRFLNIGLEEGLERCLSNNANLLMSQLFEHAPSTTRRVLNQAWSMACCCPHCQLTGNTGDRKMLNGPTETHSAKPDQEASR